MKYEIYFKNGTNIKFSSPEDVDFHALDMNRPLVFNELIINLVEVTIMKKERED